MKKITQIFPQPALIDVQALKPLRLQTKLENLSTTGVSVQNLEQYLIGDDNLHPPSQKLKLKLYSKLENICETVGESKLGIIDARGDGNCAFRAIIQRILLEGFLADDTRTPSKYLQALFLRQNTQINEELPRQKAIWNEHLKAGIRALESESNIDLQELEELKKKKRALETPYPSMDLIKFNCFMQEYQNCRTQENIISFIQNYFVKSAFENVGEVSIKNKFHNDGPVFFLAACLRFDIANYWKNAMSTLPTDLSVSACEEEYKQLKEIGHGCARVDFPPVFDYFTHHNIQFDLYQPYNPLKVKKAQADNLSTKSENKIVLRYPECLGAHYTNWQSSILRNPAMHCKILSVEGGHYVTLITGSEDCLQRFHIPETETLTQQALADSNWKRKADGKIQSHLNILPDIHNIAFQKNLTKCLEPLTDLLFGATKQQTDEQAQEALTMLYSDLLDQIHQMSQSLSLEQQTLVGKLVNTINTHVESTPVLQTDRILTQIKSVLINLAALILSLGTIPLIRSYQGRPAFFKFPPKPRQSVNQVNQNLLGLVSRI